MKEKKINSKPHGCIKSIGGFAGLLVIAFTLLILGLFGLRAAGSYLIVSTEVQASDCIIVLSGGEDTRMRTALQLYDENFARMIILTETGEVVEGYDHLHSFDMRIQLLTNGVPSGNILLTDDVVNNTKDEARAVKNLMLSRQMWSGIIVTDPYHTRRAYKIFMEEFKDTGIRLSIQPTFNSWYSARTWFFQIEGWQLTFLEYAKILSEKLNILAD